MMTMIAMIEIAIHNNNYSNKNQNNNSKNNTNDKNNTNSDNSTGSNHESQYKVVTYSHSNIKLR